MCYTAGMFKNNQWRPILFLFLPLFLYYYLIAYLLYQGGYVHLQLIFFAEKAALAIHGVPPRLENIGFVYPPLSFLAILIFQDPLLGQAVIAALLTAFRLIGKK